MPTDYDLVLKKLELLSVEEFQQRVEDRAGEMDLRMEEIDRLVHETRESDVCGGISDERLVTGKR